MVFIKVSGEDKDVVQINDQPPILNLNAKDMVHEVLERRGRVAETEEHDSGLIQSRVGDKSCLPTIFWVNLDTVIA